MTALPEVLEKLERATVGPLEALHPCDPADTWHDVRSDDDGVIVARCQFAEDAEAIAAAVNFLREHGRALLRDAGDGWRPIESAPQHKQVLVYIENAGVLLAQQTHLADVFATESELEALADDGMTEDEMWRVCWWSYTANGVVRMEDDCGNPTHWRPLPQPPAMHAPGVATEIPR